MRSCACLAIVVYDGFRPIVVVSWCHIVVPLETFQLLTIVGIIMIIVYHHHHHHHHREQQQQHQQQKQQHRCLFIAVSVHADPGGGHASFALCRRYTASGCSFATPVLDCACRLPSCSSSPTQTCINHVCDYRYAIDCFVGQLIECMQAALSSFLRTRSGQMGLGLD